MRDQEILLWKSQENYVLYDSRFGYLVAQEEENECRKGCCPNNSQYIYLSREQIVELLPVLLGHLLRENQ